MVKALLHSVYDQPDAEAGTLSSTASSTRAPTSSGVAAHVDGARSNILAFTAFPKSIWRPVWSNDPQERLNREIRRRTDVVANFSDRTSLIRHLRAVLAEQHDERAEIRRYIGVEILRLSRLTVKDGDSIITAEEVLPPQAITAQHSSTTHHAVTDSDTTTPGATPSNPVRFSPSFQGPGHL